MSYEDKQKALNELNSEYNEYTIEYGEDLRSLCMEDDLCEVVTSNDETPKFINIITDDIIIKFFLLLLAVLTLFVLFNSLMSLLKHFTKSFFLLILTSIKNFFITPLIYGIISLFVFLTRWIKGGNYD